MTRPPSVFGAFFILTIVVIVITVYYVMFSVPDNFSKSVYENSTSKELAKQQLVSSGMQGIALSLLFGMTIAGIFGIIKKEADIKEQKTLTKVTMDLFRLLQKMAQQNKKNEMIEISKLIYNTIISFPEKKDLEKEILQFCTNIITCDSSTTNKMPTNTIDELIKKLNSKLTEQHNRLILWLGMEK